MLYKGTSQGNQYADRYTEWLLDSVGESYGMFVNRLIANEFYAVDTREEPFMKHIRDVRMEWVKDNVPDQRYFYQNYYSVFEAIAILSMESDDPHKRFWEIIDDGGLHLTNLKQIDKACTNFCENFVEICLL